MNIKAVAAFLVLMSALGIYLSRAVPAETVSNAARDAQNVSVSTSPTTMQPVSARSDLRTSRREEPAHQYEVSLPPPADYEIIYLGSEICGYCERWKRHDRAAWRRDPARRAVRVREMEIETLTVRRGVRGSNFGRYQRTFERAFRDRRAGFPAFVMLNHGEIIAAGTGAQTWRQMTRLVREEAELIELRRAARR